MKLTVFGASGGTGTQAVRQALGAGHQVTAVVRDRARLAVPDQDGLSVVTASFEDADALAGAVGGADAALSALGAGGKGPITVCQDGARAEITAMRATGVRRLLVTSAGGAHLAPSDGFVTRRVLKPVLQRVFRAHYADLEVMEAQVTASGLEWTIVYPPRLTNGPKTGRVWHVAGDALRQGSSLSRADVAGFLLEAIGDRDLVGKAVFIGQAR